MRDYTRFIPGEEIDAVAHWDFGAVDTASILLAQQAKARQDASEKAHSDVLRQEGFADGFAQGLAQATLEAQRQINEFTAHQGQEAAQGFARLFQSTQSELMQAEQSIARGVLEMACELARQVLRRELSVNPNSLQPVIREALGMLIADNKSAVVRLNPLDLEVLQDVVRAEFSSMALTLVADASVTRGGCLVESAGTVIDGTLEKRWSRAIASLGLDAAWEGGGDER
jgi:flagellar assembly protein FliH